MRFVALHVPSILGVKVLHIALYYRLPALYFHVKMLTCILTVCFK